MPTLQRIRRALLGRVVCVGAPHRLRECEGWDNGHKQAGVSMQTAISKTLNSFFFTFHTFTAFFGKK
jgi:hypothetical protein